MPTRSTHSGLPGGQVSAGQSDLDTVADNYGFCGKRDSLLPGSPPSLYGSPSFSTSAHNTLTSGTWWVLVWVEWAGWAG